MARRVLAPSVFPDCPVAGLSNCQIAVPPEGSSASAGIRSWPSPWAIPRAVAITLARAGARQLIVLNRGLNRARQLAHLVGAPYPEYRMAAHPLHKECRITDVAEIRLFVNTTSVRLQPSDPTLFDYASLSAATMVCDLIDNPPETPLLRAARARGLPAGNGLPMLLHQEGLAFERWMGNPAQIQAMRQAVGI